MARNPVMFVVEIGSVLTTVLFFATSATRPRRERVRRRSSRRGSGSPCCSPTSPRRSPRAAARRRPTRCARPAPRRWRSVRRADGTHRGGRRAAARRSATMCVVAAGEVIPGDGEVIEGIASVDESAITGESAPVIRESGGDRSAVTGGTRVLSDRIVVRITAKPGETLPRPDDRARRRRRAAEDAERDRAQHPARRADDHLPARGRHAAAVRDLLGRRAVRSSCSSRCSSA